MKKKKPKTSSIFGFVAVLFCNFGTPQWQWQSTAFHPATGQRPLRSFLTRQSPSTALFLQKEEPIELTSYQSALCIIPPDECWDTLQRARHFAGDQAYHQWPPAIRLFHPFCPRDQSSEFALEVLSKVVERHNIQPFSITLNRWTVMPVPENLSPLRSTTDEEEDVSLEDDDSPIQIDPHDEEIQELIAEEATVGVERKKLREFRRKQKSILKELEQHNSNNTLGDDSFERTIAALLAAPEEEEEERPPPTPEPPQPPVDEFNGPAIIALEPDERSSQKIAMLRELLRLELAGDHQAAEALMEKNRSRNVWAGGFDDDSDEEQQLLQGDDEQDPFRPLIPMGRFPTTDAALQTARKLKGLWDPLSFEVTELHCITQAQRTLTAETSNNIHRRIQVERELPSIPFGCDAMVMLMGEELEMDDESNQLLANHVWEEGNLGGYFQDEQSMESPLDAAEEDDSDEFTNRYQERMIL
ncbi:Protein of unknown function (DUF504) [Seminavis robusta]|uniref:Uncharacterized protein n=1 Tax=Seminavis robusta TaxID=568900 RepID=A0A9N8EGT0_9STRA|nr:Protein of unknown function (DUF504) [Seminavis robusta]|eukprot:Sro1059_g236450.1 Protein of unknown function (DUF504) (472) ;mRNA; f:1522-2937